MERDLESKRGDAAVETLGDDEDEFASIEDVGTPPSENPAVDDV